MIKHKNEQYGQVATKASRKQTVFQFENEKHKTKNLWVFCSGFSSVFCSEILNLKDEKAGIYSCILMEFVDVNIYFLFSRVEFDEQANQ